MIDPFFVDMHIDGSKYFLENAKECSELRPLDGSLDLIFCLHLAVHPMQKPQFFVLIQLHH